MSDPSTHWRDQRSSLPPRGGRPGALATPAAGHRPSFASLVFPGLRRGGWVVLVLLGWWLSLSVAAAGVQYVYDAAGRLVEVIDPQGRSTQYHYDKAGNLTAVRNYAADDLAIAAFTPERGPIGTAVTLFGVGFAPTPAANRVQFNGVTATVRAASPTTLVARVPPGAATGPITVAVDSQTAASRALFTVTRRNVDAAPVITGFSPTMGPAGTVVTVSGRNFDPVPANNAVQFNTTRATVTTATAARLVTQVPPGATSGPIEVRTANGVASSANHFIVPPAGFTPEQIGTVNRLTVDGPSKTIDSGAAGKVALILFDGVQGQDLGLGVSGVRFSPGTIQAASVSIRTPSGAILVTSVAPAAGAGVDLPTLPVPGTYAILLRPPASTSVAATLTLSSDLTGVLNARGGAQSLTITRLGQNARYSFNAVAGQGVSLTVTRDVFPGATTLTVFKPDRGPFARSVVNYVSGEGASGYLELSLLPNTGTYTVWVNPAGLATGSLDLALLAEATGGVNIDGPATAGHLEPGQNARYRFTGTAGQGLGLALTDLVTPASGAVTVQIFASDTTVLKSCQFRAPGGSCDVPPLPVEGTYTVWVNPFNDVNSEGETSFKLWLSSDVTGTLQPNGTTRTFRTSRVGQNARYTFAAAAGQHLSLVVTEDVFPGPTTVLVYKPDGGVLTQTTLSYASGEGARRSLDLATLPAAGTYTVFVTPSGLATGSLDLALWQQAEGTLAIDDAPTQVDLAPGQHGRYRFSGQAGQGLGVGVSDVVVTGPVILPIYKPDNTLLSTCQVVSSSGGSCDVPPLSVDGTYTMSVTSPNTAAVQFSLWLSADVTGTLRPGGAARTFSTDRVGQNARYGFQGTAGRNLSLALTEDVFPGATTVFVYKPDGGRLTAASLVYSSGPGSSTTVNLNNLPATGTYSVFITPSGVATGSITLQLF